MGEKFTAFGVAQFVAILIVGGGYFPFIRHKATIDSDASWWMWVSFVVTAVGGIITLLLGAILAEEFGERGFNLLVLGFVTVYLAVLLFLVRATGGLVHSMYSPVFPAVVAGTAPLFSNPLWLLGVVALAAGSASAAWFWPGAWQASQAQGPFSYAVFWVSLGAFLALFVEYLLYGILFTL